MHKSARILLVALPAAALVVGTACDGLDPIPPEEQLEYLPNIIVEPLALTFHPDDGGLTTVKSFDVRNDGDAGLTVSEILIDGDTSFEIGPGNQDFVLRPGEIGTVDVLYTPPDPWIQGSAKAVVYSDDPDQPSVVVELISELAPEGTGGDTDDPNNVDTGTGPMVPFSPDFFSIDAQFAVDPVSQDAVEATAQDAYGGLVSVPITIIVNFATQDALSYGFTSTNNCNVQIEVAGSLSRASWVGSEVAITGYDIPDTATVTSFCDNITDPAFADLETNLLANNRLGFGLHTLTSFQMSELEPYFGAYWTDYENTVIGGGYYVPGADAFATIGSNYVDLLGYAFAWQVDASYNILYDSYGDGIQLPSSSVPVPGGVTQAFYTQDSFIYLAVQFLTL